MSREIKFRVWDKVTKTMHVCETNTHDTFFFDPDTCDFVYYNLQNGETSNGHSDYILEQYTGLKDKNGKEIYEGDIIKMYDRVFVIRWVNTAFSFMASGEKESYWLSPEKSHDIDVIGNIHENPELLNAA